MAVNKVIYNGSPLIDLTSDTVTPETLLAGETAHNAAGQVITGVMEGGSSSPYIYFDTVGTSNSTGLNGTTVTLKNLNNDIIKTASITDNNRFKLEVPYNGKYKVTYSIGTNAVLTETIDLSNSNCYVLPVFRGITFGTISAAQKKNILDKYYNGTIDSVSDIYNGINYEDSFICNFSEINHTNLWDYENYYYEYDSSSRSYVYHYSDAYTSQPSKQLHMEIIGFGIEDLLNPIGIRNKAAITFMAKNAFANKAFMTRYYELASNHGHTYKSTGLGRSVNTVYYNAVNDTIKKLIKCVKKTNYNAHLWIPSTDDVNGTNYSYFDSNNKRKRLKEIGGSTYVDYWLSSGSGNSYYYVTSSGSTSSKSTVDTSNQRILESHSSYVVPCFCM